MVLITSQDRYLTYGLLRLILGLNIAVHGASRLEMGTASFAHAMVFMFAHTPLPSWSVYVFGLALPWVEVTTGTCVLLGIASRGTYTFGLLEIAALTFGSTLRQDWESAGFQLIYALVYAALLATKHYNRFSIDGLLHRNRGTN